MAMAMAIAIVDSIGRCFQCNTNVVVVVVLLVAVVKFVVWDVIVDVRSIVGIGPLGCCQCQGVPVVDHRYYFCCCLWPWRSKERRHDRIVAKDLGW